MSSQEKKMNNSNQTIHYFVLIRGRCEKNEGFRNTCILLHIFVYSFNFITRIYFFKNKENNEERKKSSTDPQWFIELR